MATEEPAPLLPWEQAVVDACVVARKSTQKWKDAGLAVRAHYGTKENADKDRERIMRCIHLGRSDEEKDVLAKVAELGRKPRGVEESAEVEALRQSAEGIESTMRANLSSVLKYAFPDPEPVVATPTRPRAPATSAPDALSLDPLTLTERRNPPRSARARYRMGSEIGDDEDDEDDEDDDEDEDEDDDEEPLRRAGRRRTLHAPVGASEGAPAPEPTHAPVGASEGTSAPEPVGALDPEEIEKRKWLLDQTPRALAQDLIGFVPEVSEGDRWVEPFRGLGAFYDHFPDNVHKDWAETKTAWAGIDSDPKDYKVLANYDWVVTNPPYKIDDENSVRALTRYYMQHARKGIAFLLNGAGYSSLLDPKMFESIEKAGWGFHGEVTCRAKKWSGVYFFVILMRGEEMHCKQYLTTSYTD